MTKREAQKVQPGDSVSYGYHCYEVVARLTVAQVVGRNVGGLGANVEALERVSPHFLVKGEKGEEVITYQLLTRAPSPVEKAKLKRLMSDANRKLGGLLSK